MRNKRIEGLPVLMMVLLLAAASPATAQYDNNELRDLITGLGVAHNLAFPGSLVPIPGSTIVFGNTTYATNLDLKFVPPVVVPPPPIGVDPNSADGCSYHFIIPGNGTKTRQDYLGLLTDHEDGFSWGVLGIPSEVYHVHTDVEVGVFAGTTPLDGAVTLPVGTNSLRWEGRTLVTPIMDYPPWHLLLATLVQANAKRSLIGLRAPGPREKAAIALTEMFGQLSMEGATAGTDWFDSLQQPSSTAGRFITNNQFQNVLVFDHTTPVFDVTGATRIAVEATQVGGEFLRDHIATLRNAFSVSDACDRIPNVTFSAPPFLPVGEATDIVWTASDAGPTDISGGVNSASFVQSVTVQDTLPPILVPPAGRVIESAAGVAVDLGNAAIFDLADVRPQVVNDAPAIFSPDTRTLVTWSATDASGNSTTANQWITLKAPGTNTAPVATPQNVAARTFETLEIELAGSDPDLLSGRFDQLSFSITEPPANGFFVAPLFPYFIEDHRVENAFGLEKEPLRQKLAQDCFDDRNNFVPPVDFVKDPRYITVDDDGITYVSDEYFICNSASGGIESRARISRFIKDADGRLVYDRQLDLSDPNPPESLTIAADGSVYYVDPESGNAFGIVVGCDPLFMNCNVYDLETGPIGGDIENALIDDPTSVVVDAAGGILYATDGATSLIAYDLENTDSSNRPAYLGRVADPGELGSSGQNRKDLVIDSQGNLYVSESGLDRVYKFAASDIERQANGMVLFTPGEFIGWMGRCANNLTEARACDEVAERSYGYSCSAETCGVAVANSVFVTAGNAPGQFDTPQGIALDANDVLYVTDHQNFRVQRFTPEGFFAGEAVSECNGSCFVLGDFGRPEDISANLQFFYVLDRERDLLHVFETTPITDFDDDTLQPTQTARVTYQSDDGFKGVDNFSFAVSDGLAQSGSADVTVSVTRNFRPPVASEGQTFTTDEDVSLDFMISAFDPDADDQAGLAYAIEQQPDHGVIAGLGPDFTYTPDPDFFGADPFVFSVSDGSATVSAEAHIDVAPVNDVPVITFGEMEDVYGAGFELKLEVTIDDVDLTDRHVYGIQWSAGAGVTSGTALPPGDSPAPGSPTFVQAADGTGVLVAYETYFGTGDRTITVCFSDTPGLTSLSSCTDPNVTALATKPLTIEPLVSKQVVITDDLPTTTAELGMEVTDPVVDGQPFNVRFTIHNRAPEDVQTEPDATNVSFSAELGQGLVVGPAGVIGITGDAVNPVCTAGGTTLDCSADSIPAGGQATIEIEVVGDGSIIADTSIPIVAMAGSSERDHNGMVGNARSYTVTMNPDGDADGDGVPNGLDAFPGDPAESSDVDADGIGDNADLDDDNDLMSDSWETRFGFDPLDPSDATLDNDTDSLTNAEEFAKGTRPDTSDSDVDRVADAADNCPLQANPDQFDLDQDAIGDACDADTYTVGVALGDIGTDGVTDYALIRTDRGRHTGFIKSGANDLSIGAVSVDLGAPSEQTIVATAASGSTLGVLRHSPSGTSVQAIDTVTGTPVFETSVFGAEWQPVAMIPAGDEFWVAAQGSAEVRRVASDGSLAGAVAFDEALLPIDLAQPDSTSMVLLAVHEVTGDVVAELRALSDGSLIDTLTVGGPDVVRAAVSGIDGGFAVMTQSIGGTASVSTWMAGGAAISAFEVFGTDWTLLSIDTLPAWAGTGDALAITALSASGDLQARIVAAAGGAEAAQRDFTAGELAWRGSTVAVAGSTSEVGALAADAANAISLEIQQAEAASPNVKTLTAQGTQPPPPPPPPPAPQQGGGGGSTGWLTLLGLLLVGCRRLRAGAGR